MEMGHAPVLPLSLPNYFELLLQTEGNFEECDDNVSSKKRDAFRQLIDGDSGLAMRMALERTPPDDSSIATIRMLYSQALWPTVHAGVEEENIIPQSTHPRPSLWQDAESWMD